MFRRKFHKCRENKLKMRNSGLVELVKIGYTQRALLEQLKGFKIPLVTQIVLFRKGEINYLG